MLYYFFNIQFINDNGEHDEITITAHRRSDAINAFKVAFPTNKIISVDEEW